MDLDDDEMMCFNWAFSTNARLVPKPGVLARWFKFLLTTLDSLLLLLSLLGNSATLLILYRVRGQVGRLGCFLGLLVVSDLLTAIFMVTFDLPHLWLDDFTWVLGGALCKAAAFLQAVVILANSTTLIVIVVDRYLSIVYPHRPSPCSSWHKWHGLAFFIGLLLLSCGVCSPYLFYYQLEGPFMGYSMVGNSSLDHLTCPNYFCWGSQSVHQFEVWLTRIVFLPLLLTFCVCYSSLIIFLHSRPPVGKADQKQLARKHKVLMMIVGGMLRVLVILACVVITFLVFRLPSWVLLLLPQPSDPAEFDHRVLFSYAHFSLHTVALCAPAINPFLYTLVHQTYCQHLPAPLVKVFCCQATTKVFPLRGTTSHTLASAPTVTTAHTHTHTLPHPALPSQGTDPHSLSTHTNT